MNESIWTQVQRIETLLVQASAKTHRHLAGKHREDYGIESDLHEALLIRMGSGLDVNGFRVADYQVRYPFSSATKLQEALNEMTTTHGWMEIVADGQYALSPSGKEIVSSWMHNMGEMIMSLDLGDVSENDIDLLIQYDHEILETLSEAERPHNRPIFSNRLRGVQPDYATSELWHHWQLVWTMIACREDEEKYVLKQSALPPLVWFVRRQLSFIDCKPWLVRGPMTVEFLARRAEGYSPLDDPIQEVTHTISQLDELGWLHKADKDEYRLTEAGLAAFDHDEKQVEQNFESIWPDFGERTPKFLELLARFTAHLQGFM